MSGQVEASVKTFIAAVQAEALIVPRVGPPGPVRLAGSLTFEEATLEQFGDLQGLLPVDPIQDVTAQGWPLQHGA